MKPTRHDIEYDPILSKMSVAYQNEDYIAEQIVPVVKSKSLTGKYYIFDKEKFRKEESLRGLGSRTREVGYGISKSDKYSIDEHALKELVPDKIVSQAPKPLSPFKDATENVTEKLLIEKEYDLANYMQNTANLTNNTTLSGTDQWDDYANSDPIGDIKTGKQSVHGSIFKEPNVLLLGKQVYDELIDHPDVIDRVKYSQFGSAAENILARLFNVDKVIVGKAGYNSANEGQSDSMSYIWGKYAWLLYVATRPAINKVSFGYHFQMDAPRRVDRWYHKDRKGSFVRVTDEYTKEIVSVDCAYLIKNAVS